MYADFEYYTNTYYGTGLEPAIPEPERVMYLRRATAVLNSFIMPGLRPSEPYIEQLKLACCEIADTIYSDGQTVGLSSENTDGYSVTYENSQKSIEQKAYDTAMIYLADTGLLYRGIG